MDKPPKQNRSLGKFAVIFAALFFAVGLGAYELIAPFIVNLSGASGFSPTRIIVAGAVGGFCVWAGVKVGGALDQRLR